jgi:O-antigen/teichoic acid export membrane protein
LDEKDSLALNRASPVVQPEESAAGTSDDGARSLAQGRPANPAGRDLARGLRASLWTVVGYGAGHALRLGSNLILTRLLFREAFGLMALVNTLLFGLVMLSDLGIGPSIVQSKRGHEPAFVNTAWTLQVMRGAFLLLVSCAIAWPAARFYGEPQLLALVPAIGVNALLLGLNSTSLYTLNRRLDQSKLVLIELVSQVVSLVVMVSWALVHPSVWALLAGGCVSFLVKMAASHMLERDRPNHLWWDPSAVRELVHFGRWIFLSSILSFFASKLDALVLGRLLQMGDLGVYSIASTLARLPLEVMMSLSGGVMFPLLSESFRRDDGSLHKNLLRMRCLVVLPTVLASLLLALLGDRLIYLLYDTRYQDAGLIVRILGAGAVGAAVSASSGPALFAIGNSFLNMVLEGARVGLLIAGMILGHHFFGARGLVIGVAAVGPLIYPFWAVVLHRKGLWQPVLDLPVLFVSYGAIAVWVWLLG